MAGQVGGSGEVIRFPDSLDSIPLESGNLGICYGDRLAGLAESGLLYATTERGPGPTMQALEASPYKEWAWLVMAAIEGQKSGHEWHYCPRCQQLRLTTVSQAHPRRCLMTPMCPGRLRRIAPRPRLSAALRHVLESDPLSWQDIQAWISGQRSDQ